MLLSSPAASSLEPAHSKLGFPTYHVQNYRFHTLVRSALGGSRRILGGYLRKLGFVAREEPKNPQTLHAEVVYGHGRRSADLIGHRK
jgi:hypothetical protein